MERINLFIYFISFIFFSSSSTFSQYIPGDERGDSTYRIHSQLENNLVRTTLFNCGLTGREDGSFPITEQTPYEWPKNSGEVYMAMTELFIGAEVTDTNDNIIHIIDINNGRVSPQNKTWNFEPVPGYYNQSTNEIANSKNPNSWPDFWPDRMNDPIDPGWPGSWDGFLGKNNFIQGQEYYFKYSDDKYAKYDYFPDSTDLTRKGLGLIVKCRAIEMDDPLYNDIVLYSYKIKNDGTKPIDKLGISLWAAGFVGGTGDASDDIVHYDLDNNLMYISDADGSAITFGDDPVGMVGILFLKTPDSINGQGQLGITSLKILSLPSININDDEYLWNNLMIPGNYSDTSLTINEYTSFVSSSYFALQSGESTEFVFAVIFGNGEDYQSKLNDLYNNLNLASNLYQDIILAIKKDTKPFNSFRLYQNYPNPFNPLTKIQFQIPIAGNVNLKIYDILGREITTLLDEYKYPGKYTIDFDASKFASGVYIYRLIEGNYSSSRKLLLLK